MKSTILKFKGLGLFLSLTLLLSLCRLACPDVAQWEEWFQINVDGFGNSDNLNTETMITYNGKLYAGTRNDTAGAGVWEYDGMYWDEKDIVGFSTNYTCAVSMAVYNT